MNKLLRIFRPLFVMGVTLFIYSSSFAQTDTLRVLSYNVLYLGDTPPCQGPHSIYESYLERIIAYVNADIVGFNKMEAIPLYAGDMSGNAPAGFADSLLENAMNPAFPGRYAYCTYTNASGADNISMLFYNQQKFGFAGILAAYANITDFDTYKLYYKSPNLATTHDSIFLYVTLNHENSGTGSSAVNTRAAQIAGEMTQIETHFSTLPNMINMGDFNFHSSTEAGYQRLVSPANAAYRYYDPPFYPDALFSYPANWDNNPATYASCLTVSTRQGSAPNTCNSNNGGAKSWYDHIFLSAGIINNANLIGYVPHSFRVIGNDGNRLGVDANAAPNASAPAAVVDAIFQMSEHYPLMVSLLFDTVATSVASIHREETKVVVSNPVASQLSMRFTKGMVGKTATVSCMDMFTRVQMKHTFAITNELMQSPCSLHTGTYYLRITTDNEVVANILIVKE